MCQFDDQYEIDYNFVNINDVALYTTETFQPRGMTAMLDAIGRQIVETGEKLAALKEDQRPDNVLFVILTDGQENASVEYDRKKDGLERIKKLIEHQTTTFSWGFMFLGANINAEKAASTLGIDPDFASTFTASANGMESTFGLLSDKVAYTRTAGPLYCMGKRNPIVSAKVAYTLNEKAQMQQQ